LEEVALKTTKAASIGLDNVGALIVNTITGLAVPSLDAKLMNRLRLPQSVERLPIFGLGCGGGVGGLARAARYAQAMPGGSHVLFLTVDLCSLCLRIADPSMAMFVAAALFGDGAAGVVLRNTKGRSGGSGRGTVLAVGDHFWPNTEQIMGWDIKEDGFGVVLSPELPSLIRTEFLPALRGFLDASGMDLGEFSGFLMHPGGAKILKTIEKLLRLSCEDLAYSWEVLRDFGNMSSPTALFALARAVHAGARGPHLLTAFGPGFSAYFVAIDL
jgi:alkylresorcinol/alkylpyrone synthase